MADDRDLHEPRAHAPRTRLGEVWLRQRPMSWYWAAAFVIAVIIVLIALFVAGSEPPPA